MRNRIGWFVLGFLIPILVTAWVLRAVPAPEGRYAALAVVQHADGDVEAVVNRNTLSRDECEDVQRLARAFLEKHPDVRRAGLRCVLLRPDFDGAAR